jgi:hypothetical protein
MNKAKMYNKLKYMIIEVCLMCKRAREAKAGGRTRIS